MGVILVGLGPGAPTLITAEARAVLFEAQEVWVPSLSHPAIAALPATAAVRLLPSGGTNVRADGAGLQAVVARAVELGTRPEGVILALPGHPLVGNVLGAAIWRRTQEIGMPCRVVIGLSPLDAIMGSARPAWPTSLFLCGADDILEFHVPPFPPNTPALINGVVLPDVGKSLGRILESVYPADHEIFLFANAAAMQPSQLSLRDLGNVQNAAQEVSLYIPPLSLGSSLEALQEVIAHLRAPEGCPWDREQTHASLRPHLLEEAYEAMQAMDSGNDPALREELGDLLLQIMLNAQIASEAGAFNINDVAQGIHEKLIRRHPHVFGELKLNGVDGVLSNWEKLKEGERAQHGDASGLLEGVPVALPALSQAQEYQDRAARVGFDWPDIAGVVDKIGEEVDEVLAARDASALEAEIGDLLFSIVNFARWKSVDAESSLRAANQRFRARFRHIETVAHRDGRRLTDLTPQEMDSLWNQAKGQE